jgi:hypothetical protein
MLAALALLVSAPVASAQEGLIQVGGPGGPGATPDFYVIQQGDTLWDISTRFLGDPYQWPQLWSYNEYITNPHWIYPGNRIYFQLGDQLTPPSAGIIEQIEDTPYQPPSVTVAARDESCDFPPTFTTTIRGMRLTAPGLLGSPDDFGNNGKVMWSSSPGDNFGEGTYIYMRMDSDAEVECGTLVGLYRKASGRVQAAPGVAGKVYRAVGTARVIRVDGNIATALIRDSWVESRRGDLVGEPMSADVTLDVTRPRGDVDGSVVARLEQEVLLTGTYATVFLNRGTDDGVDVGTSLFLVSRRDGKASFDSREDRRLPEHVTGRVVVVRAGERVSTGVVVDASEELYAGQRVVGTPNDENRK